MRLTSIVNHIVISWGWRRALWAFAAGAVSTLALAPFEVWPVMLLTMPVTVWLLDGVGAGRFNGALRAAGTGWWFGLGYHLAGLWWVGNAFLVDADVFGWLLPVAVLGLPLLLAPFMAVGFALARMLWWRGPLRILALAVGLGSAEWLRGHLFTGFPWNVLGQTLAADLRLAQSASLVGLWGMTLLAVLLFAAPATLADDIRSWKKRARVTILSASALAAMMLFGAVRLAITPTVPVEGVKLRIMQPNLAQDQKFNYTARQQVMKRYLDLSESRQGPDQLSVRDATHLIWPESAFPFILSHEGEALSQIADMLPRGTILITGGARYADVPEQETQEAGEEPRKKIHNSLYVVDHDGSILDVYDKVHLVPFGEYLPFQKTLEALGLQQLTKVRGGFVEGNRLQRLVTPAAPPVTPLICYEIIFPSAVTPAGERPKWLLNVTNDGWFGRSTGPYQHFAQARLRAIEEGLPVVRAANTGISAIIDPVGRVSGSLALGREGVLDGSLPQDINPPLYARMRDIIPLIMGLAGVIMIVRARRLATRKVS